MATVRSGVFSLARSPLKHCTMPTAQSGPARTFRKRSRRSAGIIRVLCAVDLTSNSLPLLRWACEFASERQATLKLVHGIPAGQAPAGFDIDGAVFRSSLFEMAREELAKLQSEAGTNLETVLERGE